MDTIIKNFDRDRYSFRNGIHHFDVEKENLISFLTTMKEQALFLVLKDIIAIDLLTFSDERKKQNHRFELIYSLLNLEKNEMAFIHLALNQEMVPSVRSLWKNSYLMELEIYDLMGIEFSGIQLKRIYCGDDFNGYPLRKDFQLGSELKGSRNGLNNKKQNFVNGKDCVDGCVEGREFAYFHQLDSSEKTIGNVLNSKFFLNDDFIIDLEMDFGFCHKGFEKEVEKINFLSSFIYFPKLDINNSVLIKMLMLSILEKGRGVLNSERDIYLRMVFLEWERILGHLQYLISFFNQIGGEYYRSFFLNERSLVGNLFLWTLEKRKYLTYHHLGSEQFNLNLDDISKILDGFKRLEKSNEKISSKLLRNNLLLDGLKKGIISSSECIDYGITGPTLRAAGINRDLRKNSPYLFYQKLDFEVPLGEKGSIYDRFLIRFLEINQSIKIIIQILEDLPKSDKKLEKENLLKSIPIGDYYSNMESSNGEISLYLLSNGEETPYRCKLGQTQMALVQIFSEKLKGEKFNSFFPLLSSLDINFNLMER